MDYQTLGGWMMLISGVLGVLVVLREMRRGR